MKLKSLLKLLLISWAFLIFISLNVIFPKFMNLILVRFGDFSLENYLLLHFTVLGIVVTLIALTTSLTSEVRQDLIKKYYLKSDFVVFYYSTIFISFIFGLIVSFFNVPNASMIFILFSTIIFIYTAYFIPMFLFALNRTWLYRKIMEEFKNEIKKD